MKIVVVSDSHRNTDVLEKIVMTTNADMYLHAGDSALPEALIRPFVSVRGNCDAYPYEISRTVELEGLRLYITHGHLFSKTRLIKNAKALNCQIAIYSHTHIAEIEKIDDIYVINPGSIAYPRGKIGPTYIEIDYTTIDDVAIRIVELR